MPLFGAALADQSAMMTAGLPIDTGHTAQAMHVGYPAAATMSINDISAMMMMSDVYHGNAPAIDQSAAVKHMLHSVIHHVLYHHQLQHYCAARYWLLVQRSCIHLVGGGVWIYSGMSVCPSRPGCLSGAFCLPPTHTPHPRWRRAVRSSIELILVFLDTIWVMLWIKVIFQKSRSYGIIFK